jgi:hypothetical protein
MTVGFYLDDHDEMDDLSIDFAFDFEGMLVTCIYTGGLWRRGVPELYVRPPESQMTGDAITDARLAVFLAGGVIRLGQGLLASDGFTVPPYSTEFDGRPVRFWLGDPESPSRLLARRLEDEVDTVIQVHCSLWHAPLLGSG